MHGFLTFIKHSTRFCLQSLHHLSVNWTKPDTATTLMMGTLTDLARSKSELIAENALLCQNGSHAPRISCKNGSNMETRAVHRAARDAHAVASSGIQAVLEV